MHLRSLASLLNKEMFQVSRFNMFIFLEGTEAQISYWHRYWKISNDNHPPSYAEDMKIEIEILDRRYFLGWNLIFWHCSWDFPDSDFFVLIILSLEGMNFQNKAVWHRLQEQERGKARPNCHGARRRHEALCFAQTNPLRRRGVWCAMGRWGPHGASPTPLTSTSSLTLTNTHTHTHTHFSSETADVLTGLQQLTGYRWGRGDPS